MIAVQIADHFLLRRDRFAVAADARNLVIWLIGFVAYRLLMGVDTPVGYTLPDMVLTILLCVIAEKLKPSVKQSYHPFPPAQKQETPPGGAASPAFVSSSKKPRRVCRL